MGSPWGKKSSDEDLWEYAKMTLCGSRCKSQMTLQTTVVFSPRQMHLLFRSVRVRLRGTDAYGLEEDGRFGNFTNDHISGFSSRFWRARMSWQEILAQITERAFGLGNGVLIISLICLDSEWRHGSESTVNPVLPREHFQEWLSVSEDKTAVRPLFTLVFPQYLPMLICFAKMWNMQGYFGCKANCSNRSKCSGCLSWTCGALFGFPS